MNSQATHLNALLHQLQQACILLKGTQLLDANQAFLNGYTLKRDELIGQNIQALWPELNWPLPIEGQLYQWQHQTLQIVPLIQSDDVQLLQFLALPSSHTHSSKLLKLAQRIGAVGHFHWNTHTNQVSWSSETYRIFEVSPEEEITLEVYLSFIYPEDGPRLKAAIEQLQEGQELHLLHRLLLRSGQIKHVECLGQLSIHHGQNVLSGVIRDLTPLYELQELLNTQQAWIEQLFQHANLGVARLNSQAEVLQINPYFQSLLSQIDAGLMLENLQFESDLPSLLAQMREEQLSVQQRVARLSTRDGAVRWIHCGIYALPPLTPIGHPQFIMLAQDITQETENTQRLQAVLSSFHDIIFLMDQDLRFLNVWTNDEGQLYLSKEDFLGSTMNELKEHFPSPVWEINMTLLEKALKTGKIIRHEYFDPAINQWYLNTIQPVHSPQKDQKLLAVVLHNITEHKKAEQQLKEAKAEAERANQAKSMFLANMSHELRTPLNAILGFSRVLKSRTTLPSERKKLFLDRIAGNALHLTEIINDLLDLSRLEAGHVELHWEDVSTKEFSESLLESARPLIESNGNTLHLDCPNSLQTIHIDPLRCRQILLNLLSNAGKFTENGDVYLRCRLQDDGLIFEVEDTGIGIEENFQSQIFDNFTQAENSLSRKYQGTGLGLSISQKWAQLMGGRLEFSSRVNQGSCFRLYLPQS